MKRTALLFAFEMIAAYSFSQTAYLSPNAWQVSGVVNCIHKKGNTVFLGGRFSAVGPYTPKSCAVTLLSGKAEPTFAKPNDQVYASVPDGNGGWFLGGWFTQMGGQPRGYLAKINADGTVAPWVANTNGIVEAVVRKDGVLYVGGRFTTIGGVSRNYLAAVDANTGAVLPWNPAPNGYIWSLALGNNTLYVGGSFSTIGGLTRRGIAAFDLTTGITTAWNPNASYNSFSGSVSKMSLQNGKLYVGGDITSIGGAARNYLAALDTATGLATNWNPNPNESIISLETTSSKIFVAGLFTSIGGKARKYIAALDLTTDTALAELNLNPNDYVTDLKLIDEHLYVCGYFTSINSQIRNRLAALDTLGNLLSWNPDADASAHRIVPLNDKVYVSGQFNSVGRITRYNLAAVSAITGEPTSWNPSQGILPIGNDEVFCLTDDGNKLYAGGRFTTIGNASRTNIAAFDLATGAISAWSPTINVGPNSLVTALHLKENRLYIGGRFSSVTGESRNGLAAFDAATGNIVSWNPNPGPSESAVSSILSSGNTLYIGGSFTSMGGQQRYYLAAADAVTANVKPWNPGLASGGSASLLMKGSTVYFSGGFSQVAGQSRNGLAAMDTFGTLLPWNPNINGQVRTMALVNNAVIAGGYITVNSQNRFRLVALDGISGNLLSWGLYIDPPPATTSVYTVLPVDGTSVYVGGSFSSILGESRRSFAKVVTPFPLPVQLLAFSANAREGAPRQVICRWSTAAEDNVSHFLAERSTNGNDFEVVGKVAANGVPGRTTNYEFTDQAPLFNPSYYRLKTLDKDGLIAYSKVVAVPGMRSNFEIRGMYPSPTKGKITLVLQSDKDDMATLIATSMEGKEIMNQPKRLSKGTNAFLLNFSPLPNGSYFLTVRTTSGSHTIEWNKE